MTKNGLYQYQRACAAIAVAVAAAARTSAQALSTRHIEVTVTEASGRFVTGLERGDFEILENGIRRAITRFGASGSPVSLAIVSKEPLPVIYMPGAADDLIQTTSLSDALQPLAATPNSRRATATTAEVSTAIPLEIELVKVDRDGVAKAVVELRNQYRLEFESGHAFGESRSGGQTAARPSSFESELEVIA